MFKYFFAVLALHLACQHGNLEAVQVLLTESNVNAEAYNAKLVTIEDMKFIFHLI